MLGADGIRVGWVIVASPLEGSTCVPMLGSQAIGWRLIVAGVVRVDAQRLAGIASSAMDLAGRVHDEAAGLPLPEQVSGAFGNYADSVETATAGQLRAAAGSVGAAVGEGFAPALRSTARVFTEQDAISADGLIRTPDVSNDYHPGPHA